jgi:pimeloyl-ACP methyl ester carboxylesterase
MIHLADPLNPKITKFYANIPAEEIRKFRDFCDAFPYRTIPHKGIDWPYLISSGSGEALLMLSGALTHPDISWQSIAHFGEKHRVIAPAYPAVRTMDELCDGIAAILQHEGITRAHVMGGSYGGFVGQVFVRRFPAVTRSLILSHTSAPDSTGVEQTRRLMKALYILPTGVLRGLLNRSLGKLMPADSSSPAVQLMLAMTREITNHHLTKADLIGIMDRTFDFYLRPFTAADLAGWPGNILLMLAEDDPASPERVRTAFKELYPRAQWKLFRGTGHTTAVSNQEEYQAAMDEFLRAQA